MMKFGNEPERQSNYIWIELGYCVLLSILFLLVCTKSSPLYPFNDWVDANASFTMGKGMMNGKILYRDIFCHRGPYLYLLYGMGYLISNSTFLGIYIIEVISFSVFLFFCYKSISLFLDKKYSLISLPLICGFVLNLRSFMHGGSPEEFSLPFLAISLYYSIRYFRVVYPEKIPYLWVFINGILAGFIMWIKFSILGFWIGWIGSILIDSLIRKQFIHMMKISIFFLLGMLTTTIPWLLYFGITNAIPDWIYSYVTLNITGYAKTMSLFSRILFVLRKIYYPLFEDPIAVGLIALGLLVFLSAKRYYRFFIGKINLLFCVVFLAISVYGGGKGGHYYFLIFAPFLIFGIIFFLSLYEADYGKIKTRKMLFVLILATTVLTFVITIISNPNTNMLNVEKSDIVQYKYARIINETQNASLLNYGGLDSGFFTTTGIIPVTRFFYQPNFDYSRIPIIKDEQNRYIKEKLIDYVIYPVRVQDYGEIDNPFLNENYELIRDDIQRYENNDYRYLLYKKIE